MAKRRHFQTSITVWLDPDEVEQLDTYLAPGQSRSGYVTDLVRAQLGTSDRSVSPHAATAVAVAGALPAPPPQTYRAADPTSAQRTAIDHRSAAAARPQDVLARFSFGTTRPAAPPHTASIPAFEARPAFKASSSAHRAIRTMPLNEDEREIVRSAVLALRSRGHDRQRRPPLTVKELIEACEAHWLGEPPDSLAARYLITTPVMDRALAEVEEELRRTRLFDPAQAAMPRSA